MIRPFYNVDYVFRPLDEPSYRLAKIIIEPEIKKNTNLFPIGLVGRPKNGAWCDNNTRKLRFARRGLAERRRRDGADYFFATDVRTSSDFPFAEISVS